MVGTLRGEADASDALSSPEQVLADVSNGAMFVVVDDGAPTGDGYLVMAAQMATPDAITFMAVNARGLICLAITRSRADALGLELQSPDGAGHGRFDYALSIEARTGVTTGISAMDRSRTIATAIDAAHGADALVSPGHIFPLIARNGGVLVRSGPSEAAVDIMRLAGLNASAVMCSVLDEDGGSARMPALARFAKQHGMRIVSIRDLIEYRCRYDRLVERRAELTFDSVHGGRWDAIAYVNKVTGHEVVALRKGNITPGKPTLVRIHTHSIFPDVFGEDVDRRLLLSRSMEIISEQGTGVVVVVNRGDSDVISRYMRLRAAGKGAGDPGIEALRDYGIGAQILADLAVQDMILLTTTHKTLIGLGGFGLAIVGERPIFADRTGLPADASESD